MTCYRPNFETHEHILIFFGRNVTDKVGNQKMLQYATSSNLCFHTIWQNEETWKSHFFTQMLCSSWIVLHAVRCLPERKIVICDVFDSIYICWDSKIPINTVHCLSLRLDEEQLPSFTQRPTPQQLWLTQSIWITDSRILGPVWCINSIVLTVKGGSAVTRRYFNAFRVFMVKSMQHLTEKTQFSDFMFPQVVQKHKLGEVAQDVLPRFVILYLYCKYTESQKVPTF